MAWNVTSDPLKADEAIDHFRQQTPMTKDAWSALNEKARRQAFTVAGVTNLNVVHDVWKAVDNALQDGTDFKAFSGAVRDKLEAEWQGGVDNPSHRLETIFRTNVQRAYNAGRVTQASHPDTLEDRPYWMFDAVLDGHTTKVCKECNGTVLPADDEWWKTHTPPLHFNCRATLITLTPEQAHAQGVTAKPTTTAPGNGFGGHGIDEWAPEKAKYPPELWQAYEKLEDKAPHGASAPTAPKPSNEKPDAGAPPSPKLTVRALPTTGAPAHYVASDTTLHQAPATPSGELADAYQERVAAKSAELHPDIKQAVKEFTRPLFNPIRQYEAEGDEALRKFRDNGVSEDVIDRIVKSAEALKDLGADPKTTEPGIVYRGIRNLDRDAVLSIIRNRGTFGLGHGGASVTTSATWDPNVALGFTNGHEDDDETYKVLYVIHGKTQVPVDSISASGADQRESVINSRARFRTTGVSRWDGTKRTVVVELEEVPAAAKPEAAPTKTVFEGAPPARDLKPSELPKVSAVHGYDPHDWRKRLPEHPSGEPVKKYLRRTAKKVAKLPSQTKAAVHNFTAAYFEQVRLFQEKGEQGLRSVGMTAGQIQRIKGYADALQELGTDPKTCEPGTVYRGVNGLPMEVLLSWMKHTGDFQFGRGNTGASTSTSWDPNVSIHGFMQGPGDNPETPDHGKALFVIHGKTQVPVESIAEGGDGERESLIGPHAKFRIIGVSKWHGSDRTFVFELEENDPPPAPKKKR